MLKEKALVSESALVEGGLGGDGRNLRTLETELGLSRHHSEQFGSLFYFLKLLIEFHFIPIRVDHPLAVVVPIRPEIGTCIFEPEIERKVYLIFGNFTVDTCLSVLGEMGEAQVIDPGVLHEECLHDSLLGTLIREIIDVDSEVILKEVEAI